MGAIARAVPFRCQGKQPPGRSAGRSVVRTAAYNARDRLDIAETAERADYRRGHSELTFTGIFAPKDAPEWLHVTAATSRAELTAIRERLWNEVEKIEDRVNSQFARALEINLPYQLSQEGRERVVKDWVRENFVREGMVADVSLHAPHDEGDERNHHGHILLTLRRIGPDGWEERKAREWNDKALFREWKEDLAEKCARMLEREGYQMEAERWRYGHLSLPQQRERALARSDLEYAEACNREPTQHLGPHIKKMEERGIVSEVQERRAAEAAGLDEMRNELADLKRDLAALEKEKSQVLKELHSQQVRPLSEAVGDIRLAYAVSDTTGAFREALAERGFWLARADAEDVAISKFEAGRAESRGHYSPVLEYDQIVAVDTLGRAFTLGRGATGESRTEVAGFLCQLDRTPLPTIASLREEFSAPRRDFVATERDGLEPRQTPEKSHLRDIGGPIAALAANLLDGAAREAEHLGELVAPTKPDPALAKARAADRAERAEEAQVSWQRYVADEDYRRQLAQREQLEHDRRERDDYLRKERDRGRDR